MEAIVKANEVTLNSIESAADKPVEISRRSIQPPGLSLLPMPADRPKLGRDAVLAPRSGAGSA